MYDTVDGPAKSCTTNLGWLERYKFSGMFTIYQQDFFRPQYEGSHPQYEGSMGVEMIFIGFHLLILRFSQHFLSL